ncbi:MAG: hypothetical protein AMXMBFR7_48530 [Planctomycetota bacterium]
MTDTPKRPRGPSEYAQKDDQARKQTAEGRKHAAPPKKTGFLFKLIGLVFVALAGWLGYRYYIGKPVDISDRKGLEKAAGELTADMDKAAQAAKPVVEEAASKIGEYFTYTLDSLREKLKGKPPETKEEITQLVDESKQISSAPPPKPPDTPPGKPTAPPSKLEQARLDYQTGSRAYAKADPSAAQQQVQVYVRIAGKYFDRSLRALEEVPSAQRNAAVDELEQAVARRLYDCNKRKEMRPDYDRMAADELKNWPK